MLVIPADAVEFATHDNRICFLHVYDGRDGAWAVYQIWQRADLRTWKKQRTDRKRYRGSMPAWSCWSGKHGFLGKSPARISEGPGFKVTDKEPDPQEELKKQFPVLSALTDELKRVKKLLSE